jgi:transcriptional regulator with XRE-family HTH domain
MRFSGSKLRATREAAGVSRERLALQIGRGYPTIVAYEQDRAVPPGDVIGKMAGALGCSPATFYDAELVTS